MLTADQEKELLAKVGKEATEATKTAIANAEAEINKKYEEHTKGLMTAKAFEEFKAEALQPVSDRLKVLEEASKEQGTKMATLIEKSAPNSITLEQFIEREFAKVKGTGKFIEFTGDDLRKAGVQSIAGTIPVASPYAPGIGGGVLDLFDLPRNSNFITSKVNLGRTNNPILAWANELEVSGTPTIVAESGLKPQISRTFKVETSTAKKVAAYSTFTEEFDQDLPGFATFARRKMQEDVVQAFDNYIQEAVQLAARPYEITELDDEIQAANYWDALLAMMGQVGHYNFQPNTAAINWLTNVMLKSAKNLEDSYLLPSFKDELDRMMVYANKMAFRHALVGDLKQYNVDIYKDVYIKMGLINDQFIHNEYAVVAEMRFHNYISEARKKAIVYDSLGSVAATIDGDPTNSSAS